MRWHSDHTDATGQVNKLAEDNGGIPGTTIVQYQFLSDGRAVRKEYRKCIAGELADFNRLLDTHSAVLLEDCEKAADIIGRLSHTWQDYYAHAVLRNGSAGPAWSATPPHLGKPRQLEPKPQAGGVGRLWRCGRAWP